MKMGINFRWKIFLLTVCVYVISLSVISVIITENSYHTLLRKEITRLLDKEDNIRLTGFLYIRTNRDISNNKLPIDKYTNILIDMFRSEEYNLLFLNERLELLSYTNPVAEVYPEDGLMKALQGNRNYMLKWIGNRHYLLIADSIQIENEKMILLFAEDISDIDTQRKEQYQFFALVGIISFILVAIVTGVMTKILMKPIDNLKRVSKDIASGNYSNRLVITSGDEIGELGEQFNVMAYEIEKKVNELQNESERKQRFIDNLTHELRTPLTSIIGYSDTLMKIPYNREIFLKSLKFIYSEGNRMLKMVSQLMDLVLLKKYTFDMKEEYIKPLLIEVKELLNQKIKAKNMTVEIYGGNQKRKMNKDFMKAALINLLDNAINASENGDKITMGVKTEDDYDCIYIKDQGKGISETDVKRVTEPYYRVDKARSTKNGGAGLGLSICQEIINMHDAKLKIESKVGEGTVVSIIFYNSDTNLKKD